MAKQGEIDYLDKIGEAGIWHAVNKPFSDEGCSRYLMEMGAIMLLLPPPPARLLDLGCGTGWTSLFFARRGYQVVGADISPDMIHWANQTRDAAGIENAEFLEGDYEDLAFHEEFDAAVFYDSLHHAVDEGLAVRKACEALKPGGVCVASEPGTGHEHSSAAVEAMRNYNVTEKDMPPHKIASLARKAGFARVEVFPHAYDLADWFFRPGPGGPLEPAGLNGSARPGEGGLWNDPRAVPALARRAGGGRARRLLRLAKWPWRQLGAMRGLNRLAAWDDVLDSEVVAQFAARMQAIGHHGLVRLVKSTSY